MGGCKGVSMTLEEAIKVGKIISQADGGTCTICVKELISECEKYFSEFKWEYNKEYDYIKDESRVIVKELT